jgi:alkylation response protein AidB-like acyl-CoA dehydrogenase
MDLELDADQVALAEAARRVVQGPLDLETIRTFEHARDVPAPEIWAVLGEAGVFALMAPEELGGLGFGMREAVVVFEELGRGLVPGPLGASVLVGWLAACEEFVRLQLEEVLARRGRSLADVMSGRAVVGDALVGIPLVACLERLDAVVLADEACVTAIDPQDLGAQRVVDEPLDPLTPLWLLEEPMGSGSDAARLERSGRQPVAPGGEERRLEQVPLGPNWHRRRCLLDAAFEVGMAQACIERTVHYARTRQQFGRPIGSFQAVQHLAADMLVRTELARHATYVAACALDGAGDEDERRSVAAAVALASEAARKNAEAGIQLHGGMGFTWEVPMHLYWKRARVMGELHALDRWARRELAGALAAGR